ncbi:hypothetical protein F7725_019521 [Dissostichus mawsoni]|uniref:Lebercilin domain-containing protein n=1 Tax=Dissostichus mawsoni TaxID=36200 RepID=A0A7J5YJY5_DISMA|nr:hypothetical protein F7725_019521 [Dissostichus mawsoni]
MKDSEEQLQRSQATIARLKKLVDQRDLGARDELSRKLEEEKTRALEAERKIKEKERELDDRNIYANRMMKPAPRKDVDCVTKRKIPSRSSTKAVQTKDRAPSLDFPTPPPAITDANEFSEQAPDEYLSLKEFAGVDRQVETEDRHLKWEQQKTSNKEIEGNKEKELVKENDKGLQKEEKLQLNQELNLLEEKAKQLREEEKKEKEDRKRMSSLLRQEEENNRKRGHVQEEVDRWNHGALSNRQTAEEARRTKELLLAKMREIDRQEHGSQDAIFSESIPSESNKTTSNHASPRLPEQRNSSVFNLTEPEESAGFRSGGGDSGRRRSGMEGGTATAGVGRRALRTQISGDDLAFGSYAPSFGNSASRGSSGFPPPPPKQDRDSSLEAIGVFSLRGVETEKEKDTDGGAEKDRKASLMQQLFGALATPLGDSVSTYNKMEVLKNPPTTNGVRKREGLLSFNSGSSILQYPPSTPSTWQTAGPPSVPSPHLMMT